MKLVKLKNIQFYDDENLLHRLDSLSVTDISNVSTNTNILRYTLPYKANYLNVGGITTYQRVTHTKRPLNFAMTNNHLFAREIINGLILNKYKTIF
jgi:hypothetical protein